jgi:hypothetical protein
MVMPRGRSSEQENSGLAKPSRGEPGPDPLPTVLTPEQVAEALGGTIIASYPNASQASPPPRGPRDAATVLMAAGRRVALRGDVYSVDGKPVTAEALGRLAAAELRAQRHQQPQAGR